MSFPKAAGASTVIVGFAAACGGSIALGGAGLDGGVGSSPDSGSQPPSCEPGGPGMTNCGPGGSGTESCCTSLEVTGGTYYRTYDPVDGGAVTLADDGGPAGLADPATVSGFRLDKYEVTVGRFRQFVNAWTGGSGWLPPAGSGKHTHLNGGRGLANSGSPGTYETGWVASDDSNIASTTANLTSCSPYYTWTVSAGNQENLPINCVNWYEAYAFCVWDGGFLPSEAEWGYAAAGGSQQREYPWGSTDPGTASQYSIYSCEYPSGSGSCSTTTSAANIAPVGTAAQGSGLWGQFDLASDVSQWNLDWYSAYVDPCMDCAYLTAASDRVVRGGNFLFSALQLILPNRSHPSPLSRTYAVGFRCSRAP
jgi:formylglycine-generating enzyme required for sulfatase activity